MAGGRGRRICVVGAGIAGLAAGWEVREKADLTILESSPQAGGAIKTSKCSGVAIDEAADSFLSRDRVALDLCEELGIGPDLVSPATASASVYLDGELRPLPASQFLGVPLRPKEVDEDLLSSLGRSALLADLERGEGHGESADEGDVSVGELVRSRLGDEVAERLVGPLVDTISAGDFDLLSAQAVTPLLMAAALRGGSFIRSLRLSEGRGTDSRGLTGGMERLTETLSRRLSGVISTNEMATEIRVRKVGGKPRVFGVETASGLTACDAVVLCTGAEAGSRLVRKWSTFAGDAMKSIKAASVALLTLMYDPAKIPALPQGSGFVVPRSSGLTITACSLASAKWPHLGSQSVVLRASVGRSDDDAALLPDGVLISAVRADLQTTLGIESPPDEMRISRWPNAFHQYEVGHLALVGRIEQDLRVAGVFPAGSAYMGIGIESCIKNGRQAAADALEWCGGG